MAGDTINAVMNVKLPGHAMDKEMKLIERFLRFHLSPSNSSLILDESSVNR